METSLNTHCNLQTSQSKSTGFPFWYSPETGIYSSKHASISLPTDPFLDVVSFILSHRHDGVTALIDSSSGYSISYSKLLPLVQSMAAGLQHHLGVSQGDVILLLLPNSVHFPIIFLSVLYLGAVVTTMNPISNILEIKKQIADCKVHFAFTLLENVDKLNNLGVHAIGVPENIDLDSEKAGLSTFYKLIWGEFGKAARPIIRQQDAAAIMYSSGTTGGSKGVVLSHGNLIAMVELFVRFEASQYPYSSSNNVYLAVLPMFHIYGLSLFVVGLLSLGSTTIITRRFNAREVIKVIDRYGVTHFPVVPPILTTLTNKVKEGVCENSLQSLKQVSSGAAPLSRKIIDDFVTTLPHVDLIQGYGMTESTAVGTRGFNNEEYHNYSSLGLLAPNMQAKVVDYNSGFFLPPGCYGELWLRGPAIMQRYLNNIEATKITIDKDGWLRTGDIVCFDEDGCMYFSDRLKEIIKYKGYQIPPADLEAILISHPDILDAAVTGAFDEESGEIPVAFVVRRHGSILTEGAVMDFVAKQVAPYKKVRRVVLAEAIPKSAAGKILRRELRKFLSSRL